MTHSPLVDNVLLFLLCCELRLWNKHTKVVLLDILPKRKSIIAKDVVCGGVE